MERVSFKIAKALKEAGYPQLRADSSYGVIDGELFNFVGGDDDYLISAPYVMDVWLWLWREKKKDIDITFSADEGGWTFIQNPSPCDCGLYDDPEEAIIAAIDYLVDNKLIK